MAGRRSRRGARPTGQVGEDAAGESASSLPVDLLEGEAHGPGSADAAEPNSALTIPAIAETDRAEHERPLATEFLETVSTSAIQSHSEEPAQPALTDHLGESDEAAGAAADHPEPASTLETASPASDPSPAESAPAADQQASGIESTTPPAVASADVAPVENSSPAQARSVIMSGANAKDEVAGRVSGWRGRRVNPAPGLASPLGFVRTVVEANVTVWSYLRKEGEAALTHLRALSGAKSPAELVDLQASEMAWSGPLGVDG
jgi:hypothetical protein